MSDTREAWCVPCDGPVDADERGCISCATRPEPRKTSTYKHDATVRGRGIVGDTRGVSAPREEWDAIDDAARERGISRSKLVRDAVRAYLSNDTKG